MESQERVDAESHPAGTQILLTASGLKYKDGGAEPSLTSGGGAATSGQEMREGGRGSGSQVGEGSRGFEKTWNPALIDTALE